MTAFIRSTRAHDLRTIWVITQKDISDAIKNKKILGNLLSVTFLLLFYKMTPALFSGDTIPVLAIYDAGSSPLIDTLESNAAFELRRLENRQQLERWLGMMSDPALGLVLPADFDQRVASGKAVEIGGLVDHWVAVEVVDDLTAVAERQLLNLVGRPVRIAVQQGQIYTQPDSQHAFTVALSIIVLLTLIGLSIPPILMVEEKQFRTLDALLVSPASSGQVIMGKALTSMFYCLIAAALALAFNGALIVNWGLVLLAVICGSLFSVALGLVVGGIMQTKQQVTLWLFILMQPLLLTVVVDLFSELVPERIVAAIGWIPTVALGRVIRLTLLDQALPAQFLPQLSYLLVCATLLLAIAAWKVRRSDLA